MTKNEIKSDSTANKLAKEFLEVFLRHAWGIQKRQCWFKIEREHHADNFQANHCHTH